jgi:hypothetical protein
MLCNLPRKRAVIYSLSQWKTILLSLIILNLSLFSIYVKQKDDPLRHNFQESLRQNIQ